MPHRCLYCGSTHDSFMGLRRHTILMHLNGECPVCGEKVRSLRVHVFRKAEYGCEEHMVLLGLIGARRWDAELKKRCYDIAERATRV